MEISDSNTLIKKLTDDNGYKWSYEMKMMLGSKDLWKNCEFRSIEEYLRALDDEDKNEKKGASLSERREWKKDDMKCLSIIGLCVSERFIPIIREATTAYQAWLEIERELAGSNNSTMLTLKCQFYEARMTEKETLVNYVDRVMSIIGRLNDIGCKTEEREICYKILSSIPERYKPITLSCLMLPPEKLVVNQLRANFSLENQGNRKEIKHKEALSATTENRKETRTCYKCGVKGHIAPNCTAPKWKVEKYKKEREEEKRKEEEESDEKSKEEEKKEKKSEKKPTNNKQKKVQTSNIEIALNVNIEKNNRNTWYLDSGCTTHLTNNKRKMVNQTKTRTRMYGPMKEEEEVKMKGECVVRCKVKKEEVQEVRLKDVMFVKNARKNLISVKKLCERGAEVKFKGEMFEVNLRGRTIMRGRKDKTGLYAL